MPGWILARLLVVRLAAALVIAGGAYLAIAVVDAVFGTSLILIIWQWLGKIWLYVLKWLKFLGRFGARWMPGLFKRFLFRKGLSGFSKIVTSVMLTLTFAVLGGRRYRAAVAWMQQSKSVVTRVLVSVWTTEIWFLPKWLRAGVFIAATLACLIVFAQIQEWAEARHSPTLFGIDPWSFMFGLVASFFLTNLPLIGFDHFLAQVFRPLRHRYRRLVRRKGWGYTILNWLIALRPARRRAELERKRFMRRWHDAERRLAGASHTTPARQQSGGVPVSNAPVGKVPPHVTREPTPAANPPTALDRTRN